MSTTAIIEKKESSFLIHFLYSEHKGYDPQLIESIRKGVTKEEWKQFLHEIGATEKEIEPLLPVSLSSMQKKSIYGKETSERIFELAELYGLGFQIFDSKENFVSWLKTPLKTLGAQAPFQLLDSSYGFRIVKNEITRIQYNVYS